MCLNTLLDSATTNQAAPTPHQQPSWHCCLYFPTFCVSGLQCTLPILAKCGGNIPKYLSTWWAFAIAAHSPLHHYLVANMPHQPASCRLAISSACCRQPPFL